jgi:hypothetical protein
LGSLNRYPKADELSLVRYVACDAVHLTTDCNILKIALSNWPPVVAQSATETLESPSPSLSSLVSCGCDDDTSDQV